MPPKNAVAIIPKTPPVILYFVRRTEHAKGHYMPRTEEQVEEEGEDDPSNGPFHALLGPIPKSATFPIIITSKSLSLLIRQFERDAVPFISSVPTPLVQLVRNSKEFNRTQWYSQARNKIGKLMLELQKGWKVAITADGFVPSGEAFETAALRDLFDTRKGVDFGDPVMCEKWFSAAFIFVMIKRIEEWLSSWVYAVPFNPHAGLMGDAREATWRGLHDLLHLTQDSQNPITAPKKAEKAKLYKKPKREVKPDSDDDAKPQLNDSDDSDSEIEICGSPVWHRDDSDVEIKAEGAAPKEAKRSRSATAHAVAPIRRSTRTSAGGKGKLVQVLIEDDDEVEGPYCADDFEIEVLEDHRDATFAGSSAKRGRK